MATERTIKVSDETWEKIKAQVEAEENPQIPDGMQGYLVFSTTRDIFFGFAKEASSRMVLKNARRVYSYTKHPQCGGPDALAIYGPYNGVKAGPSTPETTVESVANSVLCTREAVAAWMKKPESW